MNARFKFRLPFYNNKGEFSHFDFILIGESLPAYNAGVMYNNHEYEQCTGLKDKNGNLIYEGDIIKDKFGRKFKVRWLEEDCMFDGTVIYRDPEYRDRFDFYAGATDEVEIIGNVHTRSEE